MTSSKTLPNDKTKMPLHSLWGVTWIACRAMQYYKLWLRARSDADTYVANKVSFSTWLHKILYNLCIDNVRRVQRRLPEPADAQNEDQP